MPDIKITFAEVRAKNQQIRKHNQTLDDTLKQIKNIINALEDYWTHGDTLGGTVYLKV